jgi:deoxyribodipyrimidine photolyase-related protein
MATSPESNTNPTAVTFIIFPNQLFKHPIPALNQELKLSEVILIEEPLFFYCKERPFRIHKLKLAFHRASMRYYFDHVLKPAYPHAKYIQFIGSSSFKPKYPVIFRDPCDHKLTQKYKPFTVLPSPAFILSLDDYKTLPTTTRNATIYKAARVKLKMFEDLVNLDYMNREKLPKTINPPPPWEASSHSATTKPYIKEAQEYVEKLFKSHVGNPSKLSKLGITRTDALKALGYFCKKQFNHYGLYQDAVRETETYLFHSNISYLLNSGLLTPIDVVTTVKSYASKVPKNSLEGFIRQLLGWREYMAFIYHTNPNDLARIFRPLSKTLSSKWYTANTGITPLDNEIKKALEHAYAHHIIRLMYFLNVFKLTNTPPFLIYKWFMEVVALDAYEWVMWGNIGAMGYYTKRHYMQKPYLSSSNYIRKLSNYKPGTWCQTWDTLFHTYLQKRKAAGLLKDGESIYLRNIK